MDYEWGLLLRLLSLVLLLNIVSRLGEMNWNYSDLVLFMPVIFIYLFRKKRN